MRYFPIFLDLADQNVVVVGGGETAAQKVRLLLKTEARITAIATTFNPELTGLGDSGKISLIRRTFQVSDLKAARLVYAASGNDLEDHALSQAAQSLKIPVNVVDNQGASSFITPALVDRDPFVVAISTQGAAPVLARGIKSRIEAMLPANFGALAQFAAALRPVVARQISEAGARRKFWQRLFKGPVRNLVLSGQEADARDIAAQEIDEAINNIGNAGKVSLVGVGPGDPDLLTLKAQQRLQEADIIILDQRVNIKILEFARRDATRFYVGKTPGQSFIKQSELNAVIARETLKGNHVVRLCGGDRLHFSQSVRDLTLLTRLGLETEVVPGVTQAVSETVSEQLSTSVNPLRAWRIPFARETLRKPEQHFVVKG